MILYNSLGKTKKTFQSRESGKVKVFTCGPSVYLRPHIGNYRTFLYEDIVVRYLEYSGYEVQRSMNLTDIEDKAVSEAAKSGHNVFEQTAPAKKQFIQDMELLHIKKPILAMASESVTEAIQIIQILLDKGYAYEHKGSIFFDPLKDKDFGKLYGLDKKRWPLKKRRYSLDTYPGMRWNLGDFILWHKVDDESVHTEATWDSPWGKGRPSWNVQDPAMIYQTLGEQVDINCGGIDNIIRHHDYNITIMESTFGKSYANYYMHGAHLYIDGKKMSKSTGNIAYPNDLLKKGYTGEDIRFFLIATQHYRKRLNFTEKSFQKSVEIRQDFFSLLKKVFSTPSKKETGLALLLKQSFENSMNQDLFVKDAISQMMKVLKKTAGISTQEKEAVILVLKNIESVLQIGIVHFIQSI